MLEPLRTQNGVVSQVAITRWANYRASSAAPCWSASVSPLNRAAAGAIPNWKHPYRNAFQRDRDRIVHARAFRRLERRRRFLRRASPITSAQPADAHHRVSQIARTVASVLAGSMKISPKRCRGSRHRPSSFGHAGRMN